MAATIGLADDGTPVEIGDTARRSGLYILGGPGMGKTQLLINLVLSDIRSGHGVFFLDPHGDAIDQVLDRFPAGRATSDIILLNPADKTHTFGINVLRCDPSDIEERNEAYARAYGIFERLWRDEMGPWLQLILSNTLPVFIENQGYTLADIPLFLQDKEFRSRLLSNVRYNTQPLDFWKKAFSASRDTDQQAKVDAALTRLYILLTKEYVRHVISQPKTTLDFSAAMRDKKIILLDLPAHLPEDDKRFIGTIVISELLHATRIRQKIPQSERNQFCVFVDEFQNFATSRDFGILITEGRKFGIATTIAHQERFGQLSEDKKIQGATAVVANKIIFQTTVNDARELAPEFAKEPPFEIRRERELVVSQNPVAGLLAGHANAEIRRFVNAYLRHLEDKRVDAKEEVERARIVRDVVRDNASSERTSAQFERRGWLASAAQGAAQASALSEEVLGLFETARGLRLTIREFDRFFTSIMEGSVRPVPGSEAFADFLVGRARHAQSLSAHERSVLELYIWVRFGDPAVPRTIPFDLMRTHGLFPGTVKRLENEAAEHARRLKEELSITYAARRDDLYHTARLQKQEAREKYAKQAIADDYDREKKLWPPPREIVIDTPLRFFGGYKMASELRELVYRDNDYRSRIKPGEPIIRVSGGFFNNDEVGVSCSESGVRDAINIYVHYVLLESLSALKEVALPFFHAEFDEKWKRTVADVDGLIAQITSVYRAPRRWSYVMVEEMAYTQYIRRRVARNVASFMREYKEGAFVVFALMNVAQGLRHFDPTTVTPAINGPLYHGDASCLPGIKDRTPYELLLVIDEICGIFQTYRRKNWSNIELTCFFEEWRSRRYRQYERAPDRDSESWTLQKRSKLAPERPFMECIGEAGFLFPKVTDERVVLDSREDVRVLVKLVNDNWVWFTLVCEREAKMWEELSRFKRVYLVCRACDILGYGADVADVTCPSPGCGEELVKALLRLVKHLEMQQEIKREDELRRYCYSAINKRAEEEIAAVKSALPATVNARPVSKAEREDVLLACVSELRKDGGGGKKHLEVINDFAEFCLTLSRPENHILEQAGQYVDKKVQTRTVADMNSEMAQELASLPRFTAYAKIHQERGGGQEVVKVRVQTVGGGKPLIPDLSRGPRLLE